MNKEYNTDGCINTINKGEQIFACKGLTFDVSIPQQCLTSSCGLVLDIHGWKMNGKMQDNNTRFRELGRKYGYIVIQPNARPEPPRSSWNKWKYSYGTFEDNAALILNFAKEAITDWNIDQKKVHVTGFSEGAVMTWKFICDYGGLIASAAPMSHCATDQPFYCFKNGNISAYELPVLYMHGKKDKTVCFSCTEQLIPDLLFSWKMEKEEVTQEVGYSRTHYKNSNGTVFEFIEHDYVALKQLDSLDSESIIKKVFLGGHCFPGSSDVHRREKGQIAGFACSEPAGSDFNWGETVMEFFIAHPKP